MFKLINKVVLSYDERNTRRHLLMRRIDRDELNRRRIDRRRVERDELIGHRDTVSTLTNDDIPHTQGSL